ncbi:MAG TPA: choice-of-anchor D domain-containing protein [Usitatibacter sp.]|nr:choice-of-anchor D domain-containing protein [Usitatibacter sp.]
MSAASPPAAPRRFRYCPLIAALACGFSGAASAVPTDIPVSTAAQFVTALGQVAGPTACDSNGTRIIASGTSFTVSVATPLPTIACPNVEIAGNGNITITRDPSYVGATCGLNAAPAAGLTKVSGVTVRNFSYGGLSSGMCGKLEATSNTVTSNDRGFTLNGGAILTYNMIAGNATWGIGDTGSGSTISQNEIDGNGYGIYAGNAMVVDRNNITNNTSKGIYGLDSMVITDNTITGNGWSGVDVFDAATITGNLIANNGTGIDAGAGSVIKGNRVHGHMGEGTGINLFDGGTIGGSAAGERNIVYNNMVDIYAYAGTSYGGALNIVNNLVGTPDGVTPGTSDYGIDVYDQAAAYNITGNVIIAHSRGPGLRIDYATAAGTVSGNTVGANAPGTPAANLGGIQLYRLSGGVALSGNVISGNTGSGVDIWQSTNVALDDNRIAYNSGDGILVSSNTSTGNVIRGGSIHSNGGKNINLDVAGGPAPIDTDPPDGTGGPNNRQNFPVITSAVMDSGDTVVGFTLNSTPSRSFQIQFYSNATPGVHAGQTFVVPIDGAKTVTTSASGTASGSVRLAGSRANVTTTATGPYGTSEFSAPIAPLLVPAVSVLPSSISFGDVTVGATSPAREVTFTSTGTTPYMIDAMESAASPPICPGSGGVSICPSGDFSCATDCMPGTPYATTEVQSAACRISGITFHPLAAGAQSATIYVCDNTSATARAITLSGTGIMPSSILLPASVDLGTALVGGAELTTPVTIQNNGTLALAISSILASSPFQATHACPSRLAGGASCVITVSHRPTTVGTFTGTLTVLTDSPASPHTATLSATVQPTQGILAMPTGMDFGSAALASPVMHRQLEIRNTGNAGVLLGSIVATPPFLLAHDCPARLAPSAACTATVGFDPVIYGNTTGQLTVQSDAAGGTRIAALLATVDSVTYGIAPRSFDYGFVPVGSSSAPRTFILSNDGPRAIPLSGVTVSGPFAIARNECGTSIRAHDSCSIDVTFAPVHEGGDAGAVRAQIGLAGAPPARASLAGTGTQQAGLALPDAIDFGSVALGTTARLTQSLELRNTGNAVLAFAASITSGPFTLSGDCGGELAPARACTLVLTFMPAAAGDFHGSLAIMSNAPGGSRVIRLVVRVQPRPMPEIRVQPAFIGFGERMVGVPGAAHRVTIANVGAMAAQLGPLEAGADYIVSSNCGATLAPQGTCTADVVFRAVGFGPRPGRLQFTSNADGSPHSVDLLGTGCRPFFFGRRDRPPCAP